MERRELARRLGDLVAIVAVIVSLSSINDGFGIGGNAGTFLMLGFRLEPMQLQALFFLMGMLGGIYLFLRVGMGWGRTLDPDEWVRYQIWREQRR
jgi:hypothetical protein